MVAGLCSTPREELVALLLNELHDDDDRRTYHSAWRELRWNSVHEPSLRPIVRQLTDEWVDSVAEVIDRVVADEGGLARVDARAASERLVALVEGLFGHWLMGDSRVERQRELLADAIALELRGSGP